MENKRGIPNMPQISFVKSRNATTAIWIDYTYNNNAVIYHIRVPHPPPKKKQQQANCILGKEIILTFDRTVTVFVVLHSLYLYVFLGSIHVTLLCPFTSTSSYKHPHDKIKVHIYTCISTFPITSCRNITLLNLRSKFKPENGWLC